MGRRLRERFVSQEHHVQFRLLMLWTMLTICRANRRLTTTDPNSGKPPLVRVTASAGPYFVVSVSLPVESGHRENGTFCDTPGNRSLCKSLKLWQLWLRENSPRIIGRLPANPGSQGNP